MSTSRTSPRVTRTHVQFWQAHRRPTWASAVENPEPVPSIHACVNQHDPAYRPPKSTSMHNLVVIVRMMQKRGANLRQELSRLAVQPGTVIEPQKRAAYAKRWLRRLNRDAARAQLFAMED